MHFLFLVMVVVVFRDRSDGAVQSGGSRYEKISNNSSFGIIDIADSSTSDRIIVIVDTACFIHDDAYR